MNEEPESIWKKSWKGWHWLRAWLVVVVATFFIALIVYLSGGIPGGPPSLWPELVFLLTGSVITATVFVGLWALFRWLFCWRNFRRSLFGLACVITLIALFYVEEDWRGKHDWEKFKQQWEAKGEHFDFASIVPPPVPDDQNFAMSPVWIAEEKYVFQTKPKRAEAWYGDRIYSEEVSNYFPLLPMTLSAVVGINWPSGLPLTPDESIGNWVKARVTDLKPWQSFYRNLGMTNPAAEISITPEPQSPAVDVLLAVSKFDPLIEQLRRDSVRPYSRFPIGYDVDRPFDIVLPHLSALKQFSLVLELRAIAELKDGQSDKALADIKLILRLSDSIRTEPFLISHLVRIAIVNIALQPVWEGLVEHKWSDAQLAELNSDLVKLDFLTGYELSIRGERASAISYIDYLRRIRDFQTWKETVSGGYDRNSLNWVAMIVFHSIPGAFFYQNELSITRMYQLWLLPTVDLKNQVVSPALVLRDYAAGEEELRRHPWPYKIFARMLHPVYGEAVKKFAYAQESANLARAAIALERYRLAHGEYPETLDALAPQLMKQIPHDIINGQPLHYRRTSDGQFVLYSVGWNETDDGGVVVLNNGSSYRVDINQGDWVWRSAAVKD